MDSTFFSGLLEYYMESLRERHISLDNGIKELYLFVYRDIPSWTLATHRPAGEGR